MKKILGLLLAALLVTSLAAGLADEPAVQETLAERVLRLVPDAGELVREDIILSLPYRFLCREDCKGLCPVCGKNLNTGSCGCRSGKVDPRLEILKKLIDDKA